MQSHALKLLCIAGLLSGLPGWAGDLPQVRPEEVGLSSQRLARIGEVLTTDIGKGRLPGAVALVARKGQVAYFESFGHQDAAAASPMTKDSIFRLASMTKPITTVAVLQLVEDGRLLLNDPISIYLPQLAKRMVAVEKTDPATGQTTVSLVPAEREITVWDQLRHTSGFSDEGRSVDNQKYADVDSGDPTPAEVIEKLSDLPLVYQPGTVWEYSNRSLQVAGRIVEVISGMSLGAFFDVRIFRPLGMKDTGYFVPETALSRIAQASLIPIPG